METCGNPSITRYQQGCKCDECKNVARIWRKKQHIRELQRSRGAVFNDDLIDLKETRDTIVFAIEERHLPMTEISRLTDTSTFTISKIYRNLSSTGKITRRVANKIVTGLNDDFTRSYIGGSLVPAKKTRQIVRSLAAQGWSSDHLKHIIENNLHVKGTVLTKTQDRAKTYVTKATEDKALWLERTLGSAVGPSKTSITKSVRRGFFPLRHYDRNGDLNVSSLSFEQREQYAKAKSSDTDASVH